MGIDCWVDMVTEKAKVRSEQKTYDKNNLLMRKARDIRAKLTRSSREVRANVKAHTNANLVANLGCECEREFEFYLRIQATL